MLLMAAEASLSPGQSLHFCAVTWGPRTHSSKHKCFFPQANFPRESSDLFHSTLGTHELSAYKVLHSDFFLECFLRIRTDISILSGQKGFGEKNKKKKKLRLSRDEGNARGVFPSTEQRSTALWEAGPSQGVTDGRMW